MLPASVIDNMEAPNTSPQRARCRPDRVSLRHIAEQCGVSRQTVSRIVRGQCERHDAETCRRVMEVARALGYRPNASARATRSGRFGCVSLLLSEDPARALVFEPLLAGVLDELEAQDLQLLVSRLPDARVTDAAYVPRILRELSADGLLVNYNADIPSAMVDMIRSHCIPAVWMNSKQEADCVYPDDLNSSRHATELLISARHRRIAFVELSPTTHYSSADRREGYAVAMAKAGLRPLVVDCATAPHHLSAAGQAFTAAVAYQLSDALTLWQACADAGRRIPRDLSVIVFGDRPLALGSLRLDTMVIPFGEQGRCAVRMLVRKIAEPDATQGPVALPALHVPRESVTAYPY